MFTPLRKAIERGDFAAVVALLDGGDAIEEADVHGDPGLPLRIACFHGHVAIVRELIRRGADIDAPNGEGSGAPIRAAARGGHSEIIRILVEHGADMPAGLCPSEHNPHDRRGRRERRRHNAGPPSGQRERRTTCDRRVVSVREIELPDGLWERYFARTQSNQPLHVDQEREDHASLILERSRD